MIIEHDANDREWVLTTKVVDGKTAFVQMPLEEFEREQEATQMAVEKHAAEEKTEKERLVADEEQKKRAAILAAMTPLDATLMSARRGDKTILPLLRQFLDEHPELWQHFGDLTLQAQEKLAEVNCRQRSLSV